MRDLTSFDRPEMSQSASSSSGFIPIQQNFYATIVDVDPQPQSESQFSMANSTNPFAMGSNAMGSNAMDSSSTSSRAHRPPRPPRAKRPKPDPSTAGPTNKQQFDAISKYLNVLTERLNHLEQENNNLKAMMSLSGLKPIYAQQQIDNGVLGQLYAEKLAEFTQCMK